MVEVAFAGAGGVAFTGAAALRSLGHGVTMWAPGGRGTVEVLQGEPIRSTGYVNGTFDVEAVESAKDLAASADLILAAVPAYGQKLVFDKLLPWLEDRHTLIVSGGPLGGGALYLDKILRTAGKKTKVGVQNGPMIGGRKVQGTETATAPFRTMVTVEAVPSTDTPAVIATLESVYGPRFKPTKAGNALEVAVGVINGIVHAAQVLGNITRIEEAEIWCGYRYTTDSIGRLTEALDRDRVAVAHALGFDHLPDVVRHFDPSGRAKTAQEAIQPIRFARSFKAGPRNIRTRYIEEELPYNLHVLETLGQKLRIRTPIVTSIINVFNSARRKDYRALNMFDEDVGLRSRSAEETKNLWQTGFQGGER